MAKSAVVAEAWAARTSFMVYFVPPLFVPILLALTMIAVSYGLN